MGTDDLRSTSRRIVKAALPARLPRHLRDGRHGRERRRGRHQAAADMPFTDGVLCTKVAKYLDRTYSKDRVLHPLRRVGAKGPGKGGFERITWDEALDEIAARFKAIAAEDPQQILPCSYAGTMGHAAVRVDGPALLPPARREPARPHALLVGGQGRHEAHARRRRSAWTRSASTRRSSSSSGARTRSSPTCTCGRAARKRSGAARSWSRSTRGAARPRRSATSTSRCCRAPTARSRSG